MWIINVFSFISHFACFLISVLCRIYEAVLPVTHCRMPAQGGRQEQAASTASAQSTSHPIAQLISPWLPALIFFLGSPWSSYCDSQEKSSIRLWTWMPDSILFFFFFLQKDKGQSEITDTLTWVCKFASLKFRNVDKNEIALCFLRHSGSYIYPRRDCVLIARRPLGCCLHYVWWGPMGKAVYVISCPFWILLVLLWWKTGRRKN